MTTKVNKNAGLVEREFQETAVVWYVYAKMIEVCTTDSSTIAMLEKRGWEAEGGKTGKDAEPYKVFRMPRRALTFRSRKSVETKRKGNAASLLKARKSRGTR